MSTGQGFSGEQNNMTSVHIGSTQGEISTENRYSRRNIVCSDCEYELLLFLVSLRFGRLGFHDGHEDLSIGIHDMSFLALSALESIRITENTGVPEEELSDFLISRNSATTQMSNSINVGIEKNMVCVICQEEYVGDDVICQLPCNHIYHFACIRKWLQLRNWCSVCKTSALP